MAERGRPLIYSRPRTKFLGVGRICDNPGNQLSLLSGWIISQCPVVGIILLLSDTRPLLTYLRERKFQFYTVELEGCLLRTSFWHLCAAMGWADAETNTGLPSRRNPMEIQSVNPISQTLYATFLTILTSRYFLTINQRNSPTHHKGPIATNHHTATLLIDF